MKWTEEAEKELEKIPFFVRKMAQKAIEEMAKKEGKEEVDLEIFNKAKEKYLGIVNKKENVINIAIVRCNIVSETCPGVGCLKAFNDKQVHFERYKDKKVELIGFFTCGGCSGRRVHRLVQTLKNYDLHVIHLASCMLFEGDYPKCPFKELIKKDIEKQDVEVVEGTHH
jgi:predicted metal-binding protein